MDMDISLCGRHSPCSFSGGIFYATQNKYLKTDSLTLRRTDSVIIGAPGQLLCYLIIRYYANSDLDG